MARAHRRIEHAQGEHAIIEVGPELGQLLLVGVTKTAPRFLEGFLFAGDFRRERRVDIAAEGAEGLLNDVFDDMVGGVVGARGPAFALVVGEVNRVLAEGFSDFKARRYGLSGREIPFLRSLAAGNAFGADEADRLGGIAGVESEEAFINVAEVLNGQILVVDGERSGIFTRRIGGAAERIDDMGEIEVGKGVLSEEGMGGSVEEATVVGRDAVRGLARVDEVEELREILPKGGSGGGIGGGLLGAVEGGGDFVAEP